MPAEGDLVKLGKEGLAYEYPPSAFLALLVPILSPIGAPSVSSVKINRERKPNFNI